MVHRGAVLLWSLFFLAIGLSVAGIASAYLVLQAGQHDVQWVNMAGRQRMLAERVFARGEAYALYAGKARRDEALAALDQYSRNLAILKEGGRFEGEVFPPPPGFAAEPVRRLTDLWREQVQTARELLARPVPGSAGREALAVMERHTEQLVEGADRLAAVFAEDARARRYWIMVWVLVGVAAMAAAFVLGLAVLRRQRGESATAAEALRDRDKLLRQLAEHIDQVYYFRDVAPDRMVYVNPAYEKIWGRPVQKIYDDPKDFVNSVHPDDRPRVVNAMQRQHQGVPFDEEYRIVRPDGEVRWIHARSFFLYDDQGWLQHIAGLAEDITERKQSESSRLQEVRRQRDALVREVHHRIKNHLQGLSGLLHQHINAHPELEGHLQTVAGQISSIASVHGLQGSAGHDDIRLCDMVTALCKNIQHLTGRTIEVSVEVNMEQPLRVAPTEAVPLALIMNELVTNAIKYSDQDLSSGAVGVQVEGDATQAVVVIHTAQGQLPADFDFNAGRGLGTGLGLVRSLMPPAGMKLDFEQSEHGVVTRLNVAPPISLPADAG